MSRGLSVGAIVSAPAVVLSLVLGWNLTATSLAIAMPAVVYTMFGGVQAVTWTDVKTMTLIVGGLFVIIVTAVLGLPDGVSLGDGLAVAAATDRLRSFDFSFDLTNQYTFWSGTIAALFLFCSYFGADQSQVQRYLTARSLREARQSLLMSAYWKIPLQVIVLLVGVLVFVFYTFNPSPLIFSSEAEARLRSGPAAEAYRALESEFNAAFTARRQAAIELASARDVGRRRTRVSARNPRCAAGNRPCRRSGRGPPASLRETEGDASFTDVNYIIPTFILTRLPIGLIGLLIVGILMAATDTHRRRAQLALDGDGDRLLQAVGASDGNRRALPDGLEDRDGTVGAVRVRHRRVGGRARLADRGGQSLRIVLLRIDSRRVHPRRWAFLARRRTARSSG